MNFLRILRFHRGARFHAARTLAAAGAIAATACRGDAPTRPSEVPVTLPAPYLPIVVADTDVMAAQAELADGRAWLATRRLVPVLRAPGRRSPEAMLVTARAIAGWGGWEEVTRLLETEPWLAARFDGEGHALLARSALERGDEPRARGHAEAALRLAREPTARAVRLVLLARVLDRLNVRDSAALMYRRAAAALPVVREWLTLREAGVTASLDERERLYGRIRQSAARARVPYTEAFTLERLRHDVGAAAAYEKIGDMPSSYRLRLSGDFDPAVRSGLLAGLLGFLQRDARGDTLARGIEVLDAAFPRLDETSALLVARLAAAGGQSARAAAGFAKLRPALLTDADFVLWGRALIATGKPAEAATRIGDRRFAPGAAQAEARFVRGYALVRAGQTRPARAALQRVITLHGATPQAADARFLLADLDMDAGRDAQARTLFELACEQRPAGSYSDDACMHAGVLNYAAGRAVKAATLFDALTQRFPASGNAVGALYWAGRSWALAGDSAKARARWRSGARRDRLSYYGLRSAARLDSVPWVPVIGPIPRSPLFQSALTRAAALEQIGMDAEAQFELDQIEREAAAAPALALGAGAALLDRGDVLRAIRLGWRAVAAARALSDSTGRVDDRPWLLVYPLLREAQLIARARANDLDPALVAAVIRQESGWSPRALSRADARGLMQVLPRVGAEIANSRRFPMWDDALLFDADVNLELGTAHLGAALSQYPDLARALAAYNAGASRVRRWANRIRSADDELFIERMPYAETRDYARIVLRNTEIYRALYGLQKRH